MTIAASWRLLTDRWEKLVLAVDLLFLPAAKILSWIFGVALLVVSAMTVLRVGAVGTGSSVRWSLLAISVVHIGLMATRRYVAAFRITSVELCLAGFALLGALYPDPASGHPLFSFRTAFYVWIFGGSLIAVAFWMCNRAVSKFRPNHAVIPNTR